MNDKVKKGKSLISLTITASVGIFFLLALSICVGLLIILILFKGGLMDEIADIDLTRFLLILCLVSLVIGTSTITVFSSILFNPFRKLIYAMKSLSQGNFETRIDLKWPLGNEFKELSNTFNSMAKQLGSVELLRNNFINDFSHEFKTPIVSLKGFAKILKNKNLTEKERDEYLDIIISEADRLSVLSQNVLVLSKLENQQEVNDTEEYDLTEQVRSAIILLQNDWSDKNIQLDLEMDEVRFEGNRELLNLCWINLISNAIKFTKEGGIISISLIDNLDSVKFVIKDNGIGMSEETIARIYEKFYQADDSHNTKGNGIGLTLVHQTVKLHGGLITCESKLNLGTTFTVSLPKRMN